MRLFWLALWPNSKCSLLNGPCPYPFRVFSLIMKFEYMAHAGISQVETYFIGKLVEVSGPTIEEIYAVSDRQTFNVFNLRPFGLEAPQFSEGPTPFPTYLQSSLSVRPKGTSTN